MYRTVAFWLAMLDGSLLIVTVGEALEELDVTVR